MTKTIKIILWLSVVLLTWASVNIIEAYRIQRRLHLKTQCAIYVAPGADDHELGTLEHPTSIFHAMEVTKPGQVLCLPRDAMVVTDEGNVINRKTLSDGTLAIQSEDKK